MRHLRNFVDSVLLNQFFPVALSVIFLLVYAKCNCASVFILGVILLHCIVQLLASLVAFLLASVTNPTHQKLKKNTGLVLSFLLHFLELLFAVFLLVLTQSSLAFLFKHFSFVRFDIFVI